MALNPELPFPALAIKISVISILFFFRRNPNESKMVLHNDVLVFSFVGYEEKEIKIADQTELKVSMVPSLTDLGEVVVIGYGS